MLPNLVFDMFNGNDMVNMQTKKQLRDYLLLVV
jgi:hypothetical protein